MRIVAGQENATVTFSPPRKFDFPTTLSVSNAAADSPMHAIVRFKQTNGVWQHCVYTMEPEHRKTYLRTECTTPNVTGLQLQLAQVEAVMPAGESTLHVALREPPPCAATPRSYDKLTVAEGGKFFPKTNPKSKRWVAVLDEVLVPEEQVEQVASELAAQYGVSLVALMRGPYGFSFEGSYNKAKDMALSSGVIRFVESDVNYFGFGYVDSKLPLQGSPDSWALDRLDQREAFFETAAFAGGQSTAQDNRYRFPETTKPLGPQRPRVFVIDTDAVTTHTAFAGFFPVNRAVAGAEPQCAPGDVNSGHGTEVLSMLIGKAGIVRTRPREVVQVAGLGRGFTTCTAANEDQVVAALTVVANSAEQGDVLSLSFGSNSFGMAVEQRVNQLVQRGVLVFAATGNERSLVLYPPASAAEAFAVGGIQNTGLDDKWVEPDGKTGSNGAGPDVEFHGPASQVPLAGDSSDQAMRLGFGTSLSTPLIAGIGFYQLVTSDFSGVSAPDLRNRVDEALRGTATVRAATQIVVPFTPTRPVFGIAQVVPRQLMLAAAANDDQATWLAGFSGSGALLRVPTGTASDPRAPNVAATQVVWNGGTNAQCRAVVAASNQATAGCWSPAEGGRLRLYDVVEVAQETASLEVGGLPVAVAVDVEDSETALANPQVRAALVQPVMSIGPTGNPLTSNSMVLVLARRHAGSAWVLSSIGLGNSTVGYWGEAALAVNCPTGENGGFPADCEAFALLAKANGTAVELWKVSFSSNPVSQPVLGTPALLAERVDPGPFLTCFVPGWATGIGLTAVGLSVDNATDGSSAPSSRWSFAYNRQGTGFFGSQCGFDSQVHIANGDSMYDTSGPRGEAWSMLSRGAFSRTGLAVTSVWNPATATIGHQLRSTIRTLHPRGAGSIPSADVHLVLHSLYGDDAMALSSGDGVTWSIARVQP